MTSPEPSTHRSSSGSAFGESPGQLTSGGVRDLDHGASGELALDPGDTRAQQAASLFAQGPAGSVIDDQGAGRPMKKGDPPFAAFQLRFSGKEQRSLILAGQDAPSASTLSGAITMGIPARTTILAASILVTMPPTAVALRVPSARPSIPESTDSTTDTRWAPGLPNHESSRPRW